MMSSAVGTSHIWFSTIIGKKTPGMGGKCCVEEIFIMKVRVPAPKREERLKPKIDSRYPGGTTGAPILEREQALPRKIVERV